MLVLDHLRVFNTSGFTPSGPGEELAVRMFIIFVMPIGDVSIPGLVVLESVISHPQNDIMYSGSCMVDFLPPSNTDFIHLL